MPAVQHRPMPWKNAVSAAPACTARVGAPVAAASDDVAALAQFVRRHPRLFVLSGAGVSTASGIPGYRDARGRWMRSPPVLLQDFLRSASVRERYWARSMAGWPLVAGARPNAAHHALARLQTAGYLGRLVTQNVDGLHQQAGTAEVIELHGNLASAVCLDCGACCSRDALQRRLETDNPGHVDAAAAAAADGDAEIAWQAGSFRVPDCTHCGGTLKPSVIFFGEGVPRARVTAVLQALEEADALLVVGSSLMVYSGYRFCLRAAEIGKPIAAVNLGQTRADALLSLKLDCPCAQALPALLERLGIATSCAAATP
jgi:NAD-dependent SIR2 family protein deacetylase